MVTVIFYTTILLSSTFFVYLSEKGRKNIDRLFLLGIAFLFVFVPSAIRYDIGVDYMAYKDIYENSMRLSTYLKEPGFYFINWFLSKLGAHFQWLFATIALIFTAVAFKAYPRKHASLLHFLFFSSLWYFSFNGMRQAVALAWCLLALVCFIENRYSYFFTFSFIGATFHLSALFILLAGFAALIPLTPRIKSKVLPLIFVSIIIATYISMNMVLVYIEQILKILGFLRYAGYFSSVKHFIARDFGTGIGVLIKVMFSSYIIMNSKIILKTNKNYWLLICLTFLYAVGAIIASRIIIFGRMANAFVVAPILGAYVLFVLNKKKNIHRFVLALFILFLFFAFVKDGMGIETSYANPKRNPYQTIFSEL